MSGFYEVDGSGDLQQIATFAGTVDMWFELDGSNDIQPRAAAAEPNYPAEGSTRLGVTYGYSYEYTGSLHLPAVSYVQQGVTYGAAGTEYTGILDASGTAPAAPTLAMANQGTSNAVATISGADSFTTNTVYSVPWSGGTWNWQGSRADNGTVAFTITPGAYWFKAISTNATTGNTSNVAFLTVTGTSNPIQWQILEAVRDQVNAASLTGGNGSAVTARIAWPPDWGTWSACQAFVMPDTEELEPSMTGVDTLNLGVNVVLCEATSQAAGSADLIRNMDLRKSVSKLFIGKRLTSLTDVWCQGLTDSSVFNDQALLDYQGIYPLTFRFQTRILR